MFETHDLKDMDSYTGECADARQQVTLTVAPPNSATLTVKILLKGEVSSPNQEG